MDAQQVLLQLVKQAPTTLGSISFSVAELCQRCEVSRPELLATISGGALVADWRITHHSKNDRVLFSWVSRPANAPPVALRPRGMPEPQVINPQLIGMNARQYIEAEHAKGNEVSATEAVAHVMRRGK